MSVYAKMTNVQTQLNAPKNQYNSFGKYHYRSCEDILEGLKPLLKENKAVVTVSDEIVVIGEYTYVKATAKFIDSETGEAIETVGYARHSSEKKGMDDAQITGATSSYARKYALNGLFCIDDNKDQDTNEFTKSKKKGEETASNSSGKKFGAKKQASPAPSSNADDDEF